ncbi:MAG: molecular chaperone DjlA [Desulfobacteraceae bacterium]|nr:MAG: molecular chaperone DjlA [Desulfobacteraceae bacterium]
MSWIGKMIGGTIGFAIGGPIGAIAGAAFGHTFVDKHEQAYLTSSPLQKDRLSSNEESQLIFFTAAFSMLAKISKIDGRVSENEIDTVNYFMKHDLQLDTATCQTAQNIFRQAVHSPEPFEAFASQFYSAFHSQPRIIELMMDILIRVSAADGYIKPEEEQLLKSATRIFHVSDHSYERLKSKYISPVNKYYAVLKCSETDSNETIKKQYRKLVSEYHPDKIQSKGLPEEFVKFANDRFKEIQEAYDAVKKERGI